MYLHTTVQGDGTARMTVTDGPDDHQFEVYPDGTQAVIEYQETLAERGQIRVSSPDAHVYRFLATSEAVSDFCNTHGLTGVRRGRNT